MMIWQWLSGSWLMGRPMPCNILLYMRLLGYINCVFTWVFKKFICYFMYGCVHSVISLVCITQASIYPFICLINWFLSLFNLECFWTGTCHHRVTPDEITSKGSNPVYLYRIQYITKDAVTIWNFLLVWCFFVC